MNLSWPRYAAALGVTLACMLWLDLPVARWISAWVRVDDFSFAEANLPDFLDTAVMTSTIACWAGFVLLRWRGYNNRHTDFLRIAGAVIPLSFALKIALKWVFGRMNTRFWLWAPAQYDFHWFDGGMGFQGFPSGHMLVATPVFYAIAHFYPRLRVAMLALWIALGVALIVTDYHFVSDVLAGGLVGILLFHGVRRLFERLFA